MNHLDEHNESNRNVKPDRSISETSSRLRTPAHGETKIWKPAARICCDERDLSDGKYCITSVHLKRLLQSVTCVVITIKALC